MQPMKGRPGHCLPQSVTVVLHRVSTEGLQLPRLCRENEKQLSRRENTFCHGSACSGESARVKQSVVSSKATYTRQEDRRKQTATNGTHDDSTCGLEEVASHSTPIPT